MIKSLYQRSVKQLSQAYPIQDEGGLGWKRALLFGLFVSLFLWLFQPFGLRSLNHPFKPYYLFGYGGITAFLMILNVILVRGSFPNAYQDSEWTLAKELKFIIWNVFTIAIANYGYSIYWLEFNWSFSNLLFFSFATVGVGLFPIVLLVLWNANRLLRKHLAEANTLEQQLPTINQQSLVATIIVLKGENRNDELRLSTDSLLFMRSAYNYVEVYFLEENALKKTLLRSSLSRLEQQLEANDRIMRCHRAYLVNLSVIAHFEGDSQGYKLFLQGVEDIVPVSRRYIKLFRERYLSID